VCITSCSTVAFTVPFSACQRVTVMLIKSVESGAFKDRCWLSCMGAAASKVSLRACQESRSFLQKQCSLFCIRVHLCVWLMSSRMSKVLDYIWSVFKSICIKWVGEKRLWIRLPCWYIYVCLLCRTSRSFFFFLWRGKPCIRSCDTGTDDSSASFDKSESRCLLLYLKKIITHTHTG